MWPLSVMIWLVGCKKGNGGEKGRECTGSDGEANVLPIYQLSVRTICRGK